MWPRSCKSSKGDKKFKSPIIIPDKIINEITDEELKKNNNENENE